MRQFKPPIKSRETYELMEIVSSTNDEWIKEARVQAEKELLNRNITEKEIEDYKLDKIEFKKYAKNERAIELKNNSKESYSYLEMIVLFLFGPFIFFGPLVLNKILPYDSFNYLTLFNLKSENYKLKFKQRLILFILSFITWFIFLKFYKI